MTRFARWFKSKLSNNGRIRHKSLHYRFIVGVLAPPFFILLVVGILTVFYIESVVENKATEDLRRAAGTTALKLEREFSIRQTVLKRTGEDLFSIKTDYSTQITKLESDRNECLIFINKTRKFLDSPGDVCNPFLTEFAKSRDDSLARQLADVETGYSRNAEEFESKHDQEIIDKIKAYTQFFPETVALMVVNDKKELISTASSVDVKDINKELIEIAVMAQKQNVEGKTIQKDNIRLAIFSYAINGGSVLAAYDLINESFVRETWAATPIDVSTQLAMILDSEGNTNYPNVGLGDSLKNANNKLRNNNHVTISLEKIDHVVSAAEVNGDSRWLVIVASPSAAVLAPVRNAQLIAVIAVGSLLVGFLWVGTYFIRRTISSISGLVDGAKIFSNNKLNHKIQLKNPDEEFAVLADTLNRMADRIAQAEKEIDEKNKEFISIATHELRTPLTAIKGNLSMAYEDMGDSLPEDVKPMIEDAYKGTARLAVLINDMLDVARLEGGRVEFDIASHAISEIAAEVVDSLQITAHEKPVNLAYNSVGDQKVLADASKLRIILNNFVSNAIKYNQPNGNVTVSHSIKDGQLVTAIADTGLGIPEDQKDHMFEKFFRVQHEDRKNVVGTGLGMYITKQYILAMKGNLWFESTHGQGTTFYFSLPLADKVAVQSPVEPVNHPIIVNIELSTNITQPNTVQTIPTPEADATSISSRQTTGSSVIKTILPNAPSTQQSKLKDNIPDQPSQNIPGW